MDCNGESVTLFEVTGDGKRFVVMAGFDTAAKDMWVSQYLLRGKTILRRQAFMLTGDQARRLNAALYGEILPDAYLKVFAHVAIVLMAESRPERACADFVRLCKAHGVMPEVSAWDAPEELAE